MYVYFRKATLIFIILLEMKCDPQNMLYNCCSIFFKKKSVILDTQAYLIKQPFREL